MKSVQFAETGQPADVLSINDIPTPEPRPG